MVGPHRVEHDQQDVRGVPFPGQPPGVTAAAPRSRAMPAEREPDQADDDRASAGRVRPTSR